MVQWDAMLAIHHLRNSPEDCVVGDAVAAASVPEWSLEVSSHTYQPPGGSLTAAALAAPLVEPGDDLSLHERVRIFELAETTAGDALPTAVWRRVS